MATITRGPHDDLVVEIKNALEAYEKQFAGSTAELYRQNPGSIRVRVVADHFQHMSRAQRHDQVWGFLSDRLSDGAVAEISLLLLLPRAEQHTSLMNVEFDDPVDSSI